MDRPDQPNLSAALANSGVLTASQHQYLTTSWQDLDDDWPSNPFLRGIRDHTRAVIDALHRDEDIATGGA